MGGLFRLRLSFDMTADKLQPSNEKNTQKSETSDALELSVKGAFYILSQQLVSRLLTFTLNIFLIRSSPLGAMGIVFDMELYSATILFLSREWIRMALLRNPKIKSQQLLVNLAWIPPMLGIIMTSLYLILTNSSATSNSIDHEQLRIVWIYSAAAIIELLTEPMYIHTQSLFKYQIRVWSEGCAFMAQCIVTFLQYLCLLQLGPIEINQSVRAHAWAQLAFAITLAFTYLFNLNRTTSLSILIPRRVVIDGEKVIFDTYLLSIAFNFMGQMILKHILTVGDKLMLYTLGITHVQKGAYRIVSDLGSLIARIVFQPLEETSRALFSRHLTNTEQSPDRSTKVMEARDVLRTLLQFNIVLGAFFVFFGSGYTHILLEMLYAKGRTDAPGVLAVYCFYVPIMGLNGITEAFVQAVGDSRTLGKQTRYLVFCWSIFATVSYCVLTGGYGGAGLVGANMVNLSLRIGFGAWFIQKFFAFNSASDEKKFNIGWVLVGDYWVWIAFFVSSSLIHVFDSGIGSLRAMVTHIAVGVLCFGMVCGLLYRAERYGLGNRLVYYYRLLKS